MKAITVFFDARCGLCRTVRAWLEREPKFVALRFVPYDSALATEVFPCIADWQPEREILALSDEGGLYVGNNAWILCLWATERYRPWAIRLARPALRPYAERLCRAVSGNRRALSRIFRLGSDDDIRNGVVAHSRKTSTGWACETARLPG